MSIPENMCVCGSKGLSGAVLRGRCARLQKGLPDGQGGRAAPPGQIGRMKLFEAGRYRTKRDGRWIGVCESVIDGELVPTFKRCMTFHEEGCGCGGHGCPGCWCS